MKVARLASWLRGSAAPAPAVRVLMVCTGNICRSPTAEGVLRQRLQRAGLAERVAVDSAGTHGYHTGEPPDARAIRHAGQRGYDISRLQARPVRSDDFERFDWLLAMDESHLGWLQRRMPDGARCRLALLMSFARHHRGVSEIPDPYYGGPAGFDRVLDLVEDACDGLLARLHDDGLAPGGPDA